MGERVSRAGSIAVIAAERTPKASATVSSVLWAGESIAVGIHSRCRLHDQDERHWVVDGCGLFIGSLLLRQNHSSETSLCERNCSETSNFKYGCSQQGQQKISPEIRHHMKRRSMNMGLHRCVPVYRKHTAMALYGLKFEGRRKLLEKQRKPFLLEIGELVTSAS